MVPTRVMPCLLLRGSGLVKTVKFKDARYLGDPRNTVKLFNDKEVDELVIVDIDATRQGKPPQFELIREIVSEAFMPVAYGGGIRSLEDATKMLQLGVEKILVSAYAVENPGFIKKAAELYGSQSVLVCMDVKRTLLGRYEVFTHNGTKGTKLDPVTFAKQMEDQGAGEIVVNSIDRDGTMGGYDVPLISAVSKAVSVPVIACGGAGDVSHFREAVKEGGASAVAAGSMFVFTGKHRAVLISFPEPQVLRKTFS